MGKHCFFVFQKNYQSLMIDGDIRKQVNNINLHIKMYQCLKVKYTFVFYLGSRIISSDDRPPMSSIYENIIDQFFGPRR